MPKLKGIKEKEINGIKVDKENDDVFFNDELHKYYDKNTMQEYVSVTTLIHEYSQEFDGEFWASYKALEELMDLETFLILKKGLLATKKFNPKILKKFQIDENEFAEAKKKILEEYNRKRNESCERGTAIHAQFENSMYDRTTFDFSNFGYENLKGDFKCIKNHYKLDLKRGVYPEFLLSVASKDGLLRVSGQIDLLIVDNEEITIIDYKSNKSIDKHSYFDKNKKRYQMMKYPLNNLEDCNWNHYQLQLSLYAYMLEQKNPKYHIKSLRIIHIDHDGKQHEYECEYLRDDVINMLKHYKKQLKLKQELAQLEKVL